MEKLYQCPASLFVEVTQGDINLWSDNAARADDRALGELVKVPYNASTIKGVMLDGGYSTQNPLVSAGTASLEGSVVIDSFRAVVGSRSGSNDATHEAVTARCPIDTGSIIEMTSTAADIRWDLVYAKVTLDVPDDAYTTTVKAKAVSGQVTEEEIDRAISPVVTLHVVEGTEASETKPTIPADTATEFNIPLAYVRVPYPSTDLVQHDVLETANVIALSPSTGTARVAPANQQYKNGGTVQSRQFWLPTLGGHPAMPPCFLPSTMSGKEERIIAMTLNHDTDDDHSHRSGDVVDDSVDWSKRLFKWTARIGESGVSAFAWDTGAVTSIPNANTNPDLTAVGMGSSFESDHTVLCLNSNNIDEATLGSGTPEVRLAVDTDGKLCVAFTGDVDCSLVIWLEASGRFEGHPVVGS